MKGRRKDGEKRAMDERAGDGRRAGDGIALKWTKRTAGPGERGRQSRVQIKFGRNGQSNRTQWTKKKQKYLQDSKKCSTFAGDLSRDV